MKFILLLLAISVTGLLALAVIGAAFEARDARAHCYTLDDGLVTGWHP